MTRFSVIIFIGILMEIHFIYRIILILWVPKRHLERTVMEWMCASPCRSISENFRDCKVRVNLLRSAFCSCCFFWNCSQCLLGLAADFLEQGEYGHNTEEFLGRALHSFNGFNSSDCIRCSASLMKCSQPRPENISNELVPHLWAGHSTADVGMEKLKSSCRRTEKANQQFR